MPRWTTLVGAGAGIAAGYVVVRLLRKRGLSPAEVVLEVEQAANEIAQSAGEAADVATEVASGLLDQAAAADAAGDSAGAAEAEIQAANAQVSATAATEEAVAAQNEAAAAAEVQATVAEVEAQVNPTPKTVAAAAEAGAKADEHAVALQQTQVNVEQTTQQLAAKTEQVAEKKPEPKPKRKPVKDPKQTRKVGRVPTELGKGYPKRAAFYAGYLTNPKQFASRYAAAAKQVVLSEQAEDAATRATALNAAMSLLSPATATAIATWATGKARQEAEAAAKQKDAAADAAAKDNTVFPVNDRIRKALRATRTDLPGKTGWELFRPLTSGMTRGDLYRLAVKVQTALRAHPPVGIGLRDPGVPAPPGKLSLWSIAPGINNVILTLVGSTNVWTLVNAKPYAAPYSDVRLISTATRATWNSLVAGIWDSAKATDGVWLDMKEADFYAAPTTTIISRGRYLQKVAERLYTKARGRQSLKYTVPEAALKGVPVDMMQGYAGGGLLGLRGHTPMGNYQGGGLLGMPRR